MISKLKFSGSWGNEIIWIFAKDSIVKFFLLHVGLEIRLISTGLYLKLCSEIAAMIFSQ
jgi:hypothetical protein